MSGELKVIHGVVATGVSPCYESIRKAPWEILRPEAGASTSLPEAATLTLAVDIMGVMPLLWGHDNLQHVVGLCINGINESMPVAELGMDGSGELNASKAAGRGPWRLMKRLPLLGRASKMLCRMLTSWCHFLCEIWHWPGLSLACTSTSQEAGLDMAVKIAHVN